MTDAVLVEGTCPFSVNLSVLVILVRESRNMQCLCLARSAEGKDLEIGWKSFSFIPALL